MQYVTAAATMSYVPQWGRASEGSETRSRPRRSRPALQAAMGPSLGRLGDGRTCPRPIWKRLSRNGAEPRKARRHPGAAVRRLMPIECAAMGPSLGRLGDLGEVTKAKHGLLPQWGRASEGSETRRPFSVERCAGEPQWGRASEGSETDTYLGLHFAQVRRAAMGPSLGRLGDAENVTNRRNLVTLCRNGAEPRKARRRWTVRSTTSVVITAAMGPSLGRLGDLRRDFRSLAADDAAMGPSLGRLGDEFSPIGRPRPSTVPQWGRASEGSETPNDRNA